MSFTINNQHSTMANNTYFCINDKCGRAVPTYNTKCAACACPGCGETGATVLGSDYCHTCMSVRDHPCNTAFVADGWCPDCNLVAVVLPNRCHECQYKHDDVCTCDGDEQCAHCARYWTDKNEEAIWCNWGASDCTCDGSGRMCDHCAEEYNEPCRGCGVSSQLWTDNTYCRSCYVERYGDEFPARPNSVSSPVPRYTSIQSIRDEIAEIEARLKTNMTKGQKDDWIWLLQNRRGDLAAAEKEMWEGYDDDDLRKLDLQLRR
jgi:hypothetical protein